MTCGEFHRILPELIDDAGSAEQAAHLRSCTACSELVADLHAIVRESATLQASIDPPPRVWQQISATIEQWESEMDSVAHQARQLQASDEPSPRVWNSIEIALRQEGLIRQPQRDTLLTRVPGWNWRRAWLLPVAAMLLVGVGLRLYTPKPVGEQGLAKAEDKGIDKDDQQLLEAVAAKAPAMRETYASNLRHVNAYIADAKQTVDTDPNDEDAQESLMDAYQQKSMLYEMALDRSLP